MFFVGVNRDHARRSIALLFVAATPHEKTNTGRDVYKKKNDMWIPPCAMTNIC